MGKKASKRHRRNVELIEKDRLYSLEEAVGILKKIQPAKFDESVEVHARLGVDTRKAEQQVRGTVQLPHGTGKKVRVAVLAKGEKIKEAEEAGADIAGGEELLNKIAGGFLDFDILVATPDIMREAGKLGRVLGPKGLMPNPKSGTVTFDLKKAIPEIRAGKVEFRADAQGNVHLVVGKLSFPPEKIEENAQAIIRALVAAKPAGAKGTYLLSLTLTSTQGPGIRLNPAEFLKAMKAAV